jgi:hypothetical protein
MSLAAGSCHPHPLWHKATRLLQNFSEINLFNLCWFCSTHTFLCVLPSSYLTLPISLKSLLPWYWKEPIQNMVQNIQSSCLDLSSYWSHHSSITEWSNAHCFSQRNQSYFVVAIWCYCFTMNLWHNRRTWSNRWTCLKPRIWHILR